MLVEQSLRHAEHVRFDEVCIAYDAAHENLRRAGEIGHALGDKAAGAALRGGERPSLLAQQDGDDLLQAADVNAVDPLADDGHDLFDRAAQHLLGLRLALRLGGHAQHTLVGLGVGRNAGVGHRGDPVVQHCLDLALALPVDAQRAGDDDLVGKRAQIGDRAGPEHFAALVRRTGEHEDMYAALAEAAAWGGAIVVAENGAVFRQVGLLEIILRQLAADGGEVCAQSVGDLGMKDVFTPEHGADGLLGEVVVGRTEAARGNDDICAAARELQCLGETCGVVADNGVIEHVDAERGELLREHLRVRVGDVAKENFGADGNEFSSVGHGKPPYSLIRTRSRPTIARSHSASMSSTASSSRTSSTWGLVLGWRGVKTVQQSS